MLERNIRKWYKNTYPEDKMFNQIDTHITFAGLLENMINKKSVYSYLQGKGKSIDTVIRERIFEELSIILNVDYDVIFCWWLYECEGYEEPTLVSGGFNNESK